MGAIQISWWLWVISGFALIGLELMIPASFFIFFCGVGAVIVGVVYFAVPTLSIGMQFLLWSVISVILIALLRKKVSFSTLDGSDHDSLVNKVGVAIEDVAPGAVGKGELRGSVWNIKNLGTSAITSGSNYKVTAVDGITLHVVSAT